MSFDVVEGGDEQEQEPLDTGWVAASMYIIEVARQMFGAKLETVVVPDPEGENPNGKPGIYIEMHSLKYEDLAASMVVGYDVESFNSLRTAFSAVSSQIYEAEMRREMSESGKLIVPSKKLIVPGR